MTLHSVFYSLETQTQTRAHLAQHSNSLMNVKLGMKIIMLKLMPHPKYIGIGMNLEAGPIILLVMLMIPMLLPIAHSTYKTLMLQHLQNGNTMTTFWEYKKFCHSCQCIFDSPMAHISKGMVKTNMFLIWAGPSDEDI